MTETQFTTLLKSFNSTVTDLFTENMSLYNIMCYVIVMLWTFQLGETEYTLLIRKYMQNYIQTGDCKFDQEPQPTNGGTYL